MMASLFSTFIRSRLAIQSRLISIAHAYKNKPANRLLSSFSGTAPLATMTKRSERSSSEEGMLKHPSTKRARQIDAETPLEILLEKTKTQQESVEPRNVLHWFRSKDLRAEDNRALSAASKLAKDGTGFLLTCFLWSIEDVEWHGTSPARTDFMLESLRLLQEQMHDLNIPLVVLNAEKKSDKARLISDFAQKHDISHIFANIEYEVDELRRDIDVLDNLEGQTLFRLLHDQTVMEPGVLKSGSGGPMKVFTPYHKAWLGKVAEDADLLQLVEMPAANRKEVKAENSALFKHAIPSLPDSKAFASEEEQSRIRKLWPPGHGAGMKRLHQFMSKQIQTYKKDRSTPASNNSSRLSPYFAAGVISVREALQAAREANDGHDFGSGDEGVVSWVREVVFREFYRQMLVITPHDSMNLPHNLKFDFVQWEQDEDGWTKWCEGRTGMPFVDAGMRQLLEESYMHNRLRMNTSSYLRTNLLIDYRKGERFFAEHLVDWDLSNNTQGWEPSYTVFNPVSQAEKCDPRGDYIRKWVPELRGVEGKAVFDPYNRLPKEEFEKLGYPAPHVDFKESKDRCITRYKQDMADADP